MSAEQVFELDRHLKQTGLANKENVPWDGGIANPAAAPALEVIRRLVREIQIITYEAHKLDGKQLQHMSVVANCCDAVQADVRLLP